MKPHLDPGGLMAWRAARDEEFRSHYASPIPEDHQFTALCYFNPNPDWVLTGGFTPAEGRIDIGSSTGGTTGYDLAGYVDLSVGGETHRLIVLHGEEGELFIPFRDATAGDSTYGGGRYVSVALTEPGRAIVDFNRAVNPYCAYDEEFSCPLPPSENWLRFPVPAGEMTYLPR
jgi:uncharacterized protein (DUF1684 family)